MVDFGTYKANRGGEVASDSVAGNLVKSFGKTLIKSSDEVVATLGTNFGFRYRLVGSGDGAEVLIRVFHPKPLIDPETGREFSKSEWGQWVPTNHTNWNTGWFFDHDWEIVPGNWVMQLLIDEVVLLEKTFKVIDGRQRGEAPAPQTIP